VAGDRTQASNCYLSIEQRRLAAENNEKVDAVQVPVHGPYGGCGLDLGEHETVLLVAGGAASGKCNSAFCSFFHLIKLC
jgi:ferric-chelate reductase